jgi:hypothetical protein
MILSHTSEITKGGETEARVNHLWQDSKLCDEMEISFAKSNCVCCVCSLAEPESGLPVKVKQHAAPDIRGNTPMRKQFIFVVKC